MERRFACGERVRFLTLTEDPKRPFGSVADLQRAFSRFRVAAKRLGWIQSYVSVTELTEKGRPHIHVLATGSYMPVKDEQDESGKVVLGLRSVAVRAGFGRVVDVREIAKDAAKGPTAPAYVAKELSGYVSKGAGWAKAERRRPVNFSRDWYPGGQAQARKDMLAEHLEDTDEKRDDGPFWHVMGDPAETLVISGRNERGEPVRFRDHLSSDEREEERPEQATMSARSEKGAKRKRKPGDLLELPASLEDERKSQQRRLHYKSSTNQASARALADKAA